MSIMFNEICVNEEMLPKYTHTHTHIYIYTHIVVTISLGAFMADQMRYDLESAQYL